jgi:chromosome partitioning protein
MDLLGAELELADFERKTYRLADAITALVKDDGTAQPYSYILLDCPPSLNLLTINALCAADAVLVPLQCEFFALEGLSQLIKTVERVKTSLNPKLTIQGVVLTMFDRRNKLSEQVAEDVRSVLGDKVYQTVIPRNVRVSEAPSYGKPVLLYDNACVGSQAYIRLASEIIRRERELRAA